MVAVRSGAAPGRTLCCCCFACLRAEACMGGRSSDSVPSGFMNAVEAAFDGCLQRALAAVATKVRDQPAEPASAALDPPAAGC